MGKIWKRGNEWKKKQMKRNPGSWNAREADIWQSIELKKRKYSHLPKRREAIEDERNRWFRKTLYVIGLKRM